MDDGWTIVQNVLAFERVGIARYARCERLLQLAPGALGDRWADLPPNFAAGGRGCSPTVAGPG